MYTALIRPLVEYASTVWSPHTTAIINKIEQVQRRAARFVNNDFRRQNSVTEMLQKLKWDSLQERRARSQLVMLYKIQHQLVAIPATTYLAPSTRSTRGHDIRYLQPHTRILVYKYSFFLTVVRLWNTLPATVVGSLNLEQFTRDITEIRLTP
jgi:hypothetical protein